MNENSNNENNKLNKTLTNHLNYLIEKIDSFLSEDKSPDVLIIKANLICEYYINQILILLDVCNIKDIDRMKFHEKLVKLKDSKSESRAFADGKSVIDKLFKLNSLRNKVGHELEYCLSESDIDKLGFLNGKDYIISKSSFKTKELLLRDILIKITINVSVLVFYICDEIKKDIQKTKKLI